MFIGHVDAGKSTIGGQILFLTVRLHFDSPAGKVARAEVSRNGWYL